MYENHSEHHHISPTNVSATSNYTVTISGIGGSQNWVNMPANYSYNPNWIGSPPSKPFIGQIIWIMGKQYKYDETGWISLTSEAPRVELDAQEMLLVLIQYKDFLDELEDLDSFTAQIVDDTIFGLKESIEALEKIGRTKV